MNDSMDAADYVALRANKRAKYGNIRTEVDGIPFDSKAEAERYKELRLMEQAGEIVGLQCQPRYRITVNDLPICTVVPDFRYCTGGKLIVEDVKGGNATRTAVYRLKRRLMLACHGIEIQEIEVNDGHR